MKRIILWFRNDLRLHDNEALYDALGVADEIIPVYVFEQSLFTPDDAGISRLSDQRKNFLLESVINLKNNLKSKGSDLIMRYGKTEDEIFEIARQYKTKWVFCNRERTYEEVSIQDKLELKLWSIGQEIRYSRGKMLYYTSDLPFPITQAPETFISFRKEVEKYIPIRPPLPSDSLPFKTFTSDIDPGHIPDFLLETFNPDASPNAYIKGGEDNALDRLDKLIATYHKKETGSVFPEDYSLLSPWFSNGCISPKLVYSYIFPKLYSEKKDNLWKAIIIGLLKRDYFRILGKKYGESIFSFKGYRNLINYNPIDDTGSLEAWKNGQTGQPHINAMMTFLAKNGVLPLEWRVLTSLYLIHNLKLDWTLGAEHFEYCLLDYDPCSNWVNWNELAAMDSRLQQEKMNAILQPLIKYDKDASKTEAWLENEFLKLY